jgi:hypothetical protein
VVLLVDDQPIIGEAIRRMLAELAPLRAPESELHRRMAARGSQLMLNGPEPLTARLRAEIPQWRQVVQAAGEDPQSEPWVQVQEETSS